MNQEENKGNLSRSENVTNSPEETSNPAEAAIDAYKQANLQDIDNLPMESIGSYARLEELLTDEEKEKTTNLTAQS